jgi:outer membrane exchange protein TraA
MPSSLNLKTYTKRLILVSLMLTAFAPFASFTSRSALAEVLPPVAISQPVAPLPEVTGTGLCAASAVSMDIQKDFAQLNSSNYVAGMNALIDDHAVDRVEIAVRTLLDLSNNNDTGGMNKPSYGDFIDAAIPTCKTGGCNFFVNDTTTSFGSRLRGFLRVAEEMVDKPLHFGIYADDAVSLAFFDATGMSFPVVIRPPQLGFPMWRTTNTVTFGAAGLYPVEILYVEIVEHAALEISVFEGSFTDFELPTMVVGSTNLQSAGLSFSSRPPSSTRYLGNLPSRTSTNASSATANS